MPVIERHHYPVQSIIAFAVAFVVLMSVWLRTAYVHEQAIYSQDVLFGLPRIAIISLLPALLAFWTKLRLWVLLVGSAAVSVAAAIGYVAAVT